MAAVQDLDLPLAPDAPPSAASLPPSGRTRRSVHHALGGGAVADVLLWRHRNAAVLMAVGATTVWFLFERAGYSFLSVFANAILLLVLILFFWAKSALLLNRPLPPLPNLEISDEVVGKAADRARVWINRVLAIGHDITIRRDRKVFLQVLLLHFIRCSRLGLNVACLTCLYDLVIPMLYLISKVILVLWFIAYIGRLFNFLTLVYIGVLLSSTLPALYDKYQDHVDEKFGVAHDAVMKQYVSILSRIQAQPTKEKKTQ
ncbi:reticulon-like protein B11 isoform X1 [Musa acuminata AAA Group]|uniref:reticulon-like protein B11 isoform X1 n=1 Tax=Musa acuminata AAA Group TaxID=214697 RepID=UPI0031D2FDC5